MNTTRYMRVELPTDYEKTERVVIYGTNNTEIEVSSDLLVTADEIPREGEGYTAEEYRDVLSAINDMDSAERETAFGSYETVLSYVKGFSVSELIEKYHAYNDLPKVGEYWKRKGCDVMVVVRRVEKGVVFVYYTDGGTNHFLPKYFINNFVRTEYKSQYLEDFLSEMKEVGDAE